MFSSYKLYRSKLIISVGQALLLLLDHYKENNEKFELIKRLYLSGANNPEAKEKIKLLLNDKHLEGYEISADQFVTTNDASRRYFESCLAYETLKSVINEISLEDLQKHYEILNSLLPQDLSKLPMVSAIVSDTLAGHNKQPSELIVNEFNDLISQLQSKNSFHDFEEGKEKLLLFAKILFLSWFNAKMHKLPLDIYKQGFYLDKGYLTKMAEVGLNHKNGGSCNLGIMKSTMPMPSNSKLFCEDHKVANSLSYVRGPDRYHFNPENPWIRQTFSQLVHPHVSSISGTMLVQLRIFAKLAQENKLIFSDLQKLKDYLKCFCSLMLYHIGGHALYEFIYPLSIKEVQSYFAFMPGFAGLNLENLFLKDNENAFNKGLASAIEYNKNYLNKVELNREILSLYRNFKTPEKKILNQNLKNLSALCKKMNFATGIYLDVEKAFLAEQKNSPNNSPLLLSNEQLLSFIERFLEPLEEQNPTVVAKHNLEKTEGDGPTVKKRRLDG